MIIKPTADFVSTTFDVALAQGETGAITAKIGTGLSIPATNSYLQVDYNSTAAVGAENGPETIFYATYTSGTGSLTGVVRGQAGTTDVAHAAGAEVQCGMSTAFLEDNSGWKEVKDTWTYASATTITVPSGAATYYSVGDKLRLQNNNSGTWLYFYIVTVADTLLTVTGGSDYAVPNATLTDIYVSKVSSPVGFPQWMNWIPTFTGFSAVPTGYKSRFKVIGRQVNWIYANETPGTSNGTTFLLTLPITASTNAKMLSNSGTVFNNTAYQDLPCVCIVSPAAPTQLQLNRTVTTASWTGSGTKDCAFNITYEI